MLIFVLKSATTFYNKIKSLAYYLFTIFKDCKSRTKRMLLAKLGAEGVTLSSNNASDNFGAVEECTLVASLCDFLERVWSHGLQRKRGKSALWSHLLAYKEQHQLSAKLDNQYLSPGEFGKLERL